MVGNLRIQMHFHMKIKDHISNDQASTFAISCRHLKDAKNTYDNKHRLHTFSVGIAGSPDLLAARKVADFLGTVHHELTFTVEQGLDALSDLIYHIESYEQVIRSIFIEQFQQAHECTV